MFKDSFTRLRNEHERERLKRHRKRKTGRGENDATAKRGNRSAASSRLGSMSVPRQRGIAFEERAPDVFTLETG